MTNQITLNYSQCKLFLFYSDILEDTYRYQSEINWTVHTSPEDDYEDYEDYWEDLSSKAMKREYQICDPSNNEHWLRTKYIHVPKSDHPDLEINIDIEYAFRKCPEQLLTGKFA